MTPLAQHWIEQKVKTNARFVDAGGVLPRLEEFHSFECSSIFEASKDVAREWMLGQRLLPETLFAPAPRTWIEFQEEAGTRAGLFIEESVSMDGDRSATITGWSSQSCHVVVQNLKLSNSSLNRTARLAFAQLSSVPDAVMPMEMVALVAAAMLEMICKPGIAMILSARPERHVRRRYERMRLNRSYPLLSWSEVIIRTSSPRRACRRGAGLTGLTPLHFVRAHRKPSQGDRIIEAYWRGDGAMGIKQQRYRVQP